MKVLTPDGEVEKPTLDGGDEIDGFAGEIMEVYRCITEGVESEILGGELARDAIVLAEKQSASVLAGSPVDI